MENKKSITILVDETLLREAEKLFLNLGIDLSTAVTLFLKQSVIKKNIPFEFERKNLKTLQAMDDVDTGKIYGNFSSISELMKDLND